MSTASSRTASPSPHTPQPHQSSSGGSQPFAPDDHAAPGPSSRQGLYPLASSSGGPPTSPLASQSHIPRLYDLHPGCPLCTFLATAKDRIQARAQWAADTPERLQPQQRARSPSPLAGFVPFSPTSPSASSVPRPPETVLEVGGREIVHWDEHVVIYKATSKESLCADGRHLIVVLNRHLKTVYDLGPSDIPVLSGILETTRRILGSTLNPSFAEQARTPSIRVGFVGSVVRDPLCPQGHLHAHALGGPIDSKLPGATFYRRNVVFSGLNWWGLEDLRAEIRESTSNNRIKSGYANRTKAPIDRVPDAGSVAGYPNSMVADPYVDSPIRATAAAASSLSHASHMDPKIDRKGKGALRPLRSESHSNSHSRTGSENSINSVGSRSSATPTAALAAAAARDGGDEYDAIDLGDTPVKGKGSGSGVSGEGSIGSGVAA